MDQGTVEGIGTLLAIFAFIGVCLWAYSSSNKSRFDEAAQLPFADDLPQGPGEVEQGSEAKPETTEKAGNKL